MKGARNLYIDMLVTQAMQASHGVCIQMPRHIVDSSAAVPPLKRIVRLGSLCLESNAVEGKNSQGAAVLSLDKEDQ